MECTNITCSSFNFELALIHQIRQLDSTIYGDAKKVRAKQLIAKYYPRIQEATGTQKKSDLKRLKQRIKAIFGVKKLPSISQLINRQIIFADSYAEKIQQDSRCLEEILGDDENNYPNISESQAEEILLGCGISSWLARRSVEEQWIISKKISEGKIEHFPLTIGDRQEIFTTLPLDRQMSCVKEEFIELLPHFIKTFFPSEFDPKKHFGYIQKKQIPAGSEILVRADIHGDKSCLDSYLINLKGTGYINEEYKIKEGAYLVFLGDYVDRGGKSIEVLHTLAILKLINPDQVFLIRGNHEDCAYTNYARDFENDRNYKTFFLNEDGSVNKANAALLETFYFTMPLTLYLGQREFAQFTHGMFELSCDPAPILDSDEAEMTMLVSKDRKLSARIKSIPVNMKTDYAALLEKCQDKGHRKHLQDKGHRKHLKDMHSAQRIKLLVKRDKMRKQGESFTTYNWGDMGKRTKLGDIFERKWRLSPTDVCHYLRVSKAKIIFRGHQHEFEQHYITSKKNDPKLIATTLPVAMGIRLYEECFFGQKNRAYIITVARKVKHWKKQALIEQDDGSVQLTEKYPINHLYI